MGRTFRSSGDGSFDAVFCPLRRDSRSPLFVCCLVPFPALGRTYPSGARRLCHNHRRGSNRPWIQEASKEARARSDISRARFDLLRSILRRYAAFSRKRSCYHPRRESLHDLRPSYESHVLPRLQKVYASCAFIVPEIPADVDSTSVRSVDPLPYLRINRYAKTHILFAELQSLLARIANGLGGIDGRSLAQ
jgi:hypothetical protein